MTEEQEQKPAVEKNPHIYKPAYTKQEVDELTHSRDVAVERGNHYFRPSPYGESPVGGVESA